MIDHFKQVNWLCISYLLSKYQFVIVSWLCHKSQKEKRQKLMIIYHILCCFYLFVQSCPNHENWLHFTQGKIPIFMVKIEKKIHVYSILFKIKSLNRSDPCKFNFTTILIFLVHWYNFKWYTNIIVMYIYFLSINWYGATIPK